MKTFSKTDIGKMRQVNQDYIFVSDEVIGTLPNLFIVADGMGGHLAGDYASRFTVERVTELIRKSDETDPEKLIGESLRQANRELVYQSRTDREKNGMGTTFVAATIIGKKLYVLNIGDSRLYVINRNIRQITQDHSYVQEMVRKGQLDQKDARSHPQKNIITRAVGAMEGVDYDFFEVKLESGDEILLCSDGLTNMVDDPEIESIVRSQRDVVEQVEKLVDTANDNGGTDNISVILIQPE